MVADFAPDLLDKMGDDVVYTTIVALVSPNSNDPRSRKSRLEIQKAFMELVSESDFDAVSTEMICERAGRNRATFYNYYRDKYELLRACMMGWLEDFIDQIEKTPPRNVEASLPVFIADIEKHYMEQRRFYVTILENGRFPVFHSLFTSTLERRITQLIVQVGKESKARGPEEVRMLAVFVSSACLGALLEWLNHGEASRTDEHGRLIARFVMAVVRA